MLLFLIMSYAACTTTPDEMAKPSYDAVGKATKLFYEGVQFYSENDFERAINSFTEAIRIYPSFQKAHVKRGVTHYVLGRHSEAMRDFNYAISLGPQDPSFYASAHAMMGRIYNAFGEYENAIESFNHALRISPFSPDAFNGRSRAYFRLGNLPAALIDINVAIRLDSSDYVLFFNRGNIYYEFGFYSRVLADFIRSLNLNSYNVLAAANAALIAKKLGHYELSLSLYNHANYLDPDFLAVP